jgi:chemotaxis protein methyltransferase CheR
MAETTRSASSRPGGAFELTAPVFSILSTLIEERIGLSYTLQDRDLLASKLGSRMLELGYDSALDYYYFLRYDPTSDSEFQALVNTLVVNETFFFREFAALEALVSHYALPLANTGRTLRIWCAAASTGEEPLTLAMLLEHHGLLDRVQVVATDISSTALARAKEGHYSRRSLRQIPAPELVAKWLDVTDKSITVKPALRETIQWQQLNLLDAAAIQSLGEFDFIICRNVLIYFRDAVVSRVVRALEAQLRQGGVLLVGVSESLLRFSTPLACEEKAGVFVYRRASP